MIARAPFTGVVGPATGGGGGVLVTDSFDRADDASSLGNADTGQTWIVHGTGSILTNKARFAALGSSPTAGLAWIDSGGADGIVQATFSTWNNDIALLFRLSDINNYLMLTFNGGAGWRVVKREAGVFGAVATLSPGGGMANGDVIKVTLSGTSIVCEKNGSSLGSTTSSFNQTATKHGLGCHANTGHRWDDFSYTP